MTVNEDKMCIFKGECAHFSFHKCPIYIHDGVSTKFTFNSHKTGNSGVSEVSRKNKKGGVIIPDDNIT
jgi:hypothetical protein